MENSDVIEVKKTYSEWLQECKNKNTNNQTTPQPMPATTEQTSEDHSDLSSTAVPSEQASPELVTIQEKVLLALKITGIVVVALLLIWGVVELLTPKDRLKEPAKVLRDIDSLKKESANLKMSLDRLDSLNNTYLIQVSTLEGRINGVKSTTTIIKDYYKDKSSAAAVYTPLEVDSFFRNRYNY